VRAMTEGLRQEARAEGVPLRVSLVSPGVVHTEFFAAMSRGDAAVVQRYADTPGLEATDVAATVQYMLACPPHVEVDDVLVRPTDQRM
jgi:NADP-dependent 3-hydroxy acid dehydrogenase YdfG